MADKGPTLLGAVSEAVQKIEKFFIELSKQVDELLMQRVQEYYQYVADALLPIVAALVLLWIVYRGTQMMIRPNADQSLSDFMIRALKILVITTFGFSWSYVYPYIVDIAMNGAPALIMKMTNSNADLIVLSFVDKLFGAVTNTLQNFSAGNWVASALAVVLISVIMFVVAAAVVVGYFYIYIKSKFTIAILLVLTPIALTCLMFERTRGYVMNWVNALVLPLLTLLLLNLIVGIVGGLISDVLTTFLSDGQTLQTNASGAFIGIVIGAFMYKLILEAPSMASNLVSSGFGLATSDMSFNPVNRYRNYRAQQNSQKVEQSRHAALLRALGNKQGK